MVVTWAPACLTWSRLNKHLAPFLQWTLAGGVFGVQWKDNMLLQAVCSRYKGFKKFANQMLYDYYLVSSSAIFLTTLNICRTLDPILHPLIKKFICKTHLKSNPLLCYFSFSQGSDDFPLF